ncbi:MAG: HD domain-containing protein [Pseudomonadales bacterium]|nr:HD domain-containing protein [Pseudomonadales bacterium]
MPTRQINRSLRRKMNNDYTIEIEQIRAIQQSHKALQTNLDTCLQFFSQIINMRLPKSGSNVASAAVIVNQIGINIGLNEMQRQHLYMATLFRDIGKINFPDSIIKIPFENLTTAQQQEFRKHPDIGASYFFSHKNFEQVALIVQQHREYCNGSGYPRGLNSLAICMEAKILCAVSDYCDWQNSDIHSPSKTPPQAIEILKKNSQQHYDPGVVKALVEWFESQMNANKGMNEVRLHCHALNPGMTTSANIVNNRGHLLVAKDTVLDQIFIDKLIEMEKKLSEPIYISINDKIH